MTTQVDIYEAKTKLSDLVERAANGEDIVIARSGKPRVRLVPVAERLGTRRFGQLAGQIVFHAGWEDDVNDHVDRVLVAQSQVEGLTLVTRDARLARYDVRVLPA